jgi:shikimate dehydrogenase
VTAARMRCAVVGSPIAHSLSPVMHRAAYAELGLEWTYDAIEVQPGALAHFVDGCDDAWVGMSVTAPLKREAADYAVTRSSVVEELGVANTLIGGPDGWHAVNTDVPGAVNAMREHGIDTPASVRFLGGGATVASLLLAVREFGASSIEVRLRNPSRFPATEGVTVRQLGDPMDEPVDLLVSTIPAEVVPPEAVELTRSVFDVVYDPWPTFLVSAASAAGLPIVTGIDLLAHQAALQVELMTGQSVDVDLLRDAALESLTH